jgi:uncharacterized membrane protein
MNLFPLLLFIHVASVVIWVGGMFFAYQCLRPAAADLLPPPQRLTLWRRVFARFFVWVWCSVVLIPMSGMLIMSGGGFAAVPLSWRLMAMLGTVMIAVFVYVFFGPYRRLVAAVEGGDWPAGGTALARIRRAVAGNLLLALATIAAAAASRYGL